MSFESDPIRLRPPRLRSARTLQILVGAIALGLVLAGGLARAGRVEPSWWLFAIAAGVAAALAAIGLAIDAVRRPGEPREIRFGDASVQMPAGSTSPRMLEVAYARIFGLERIGRARWSRVVVGIRGRVPLAYLDRVFERPGDPERLVAELRRRIAALPAGDEQLRAIDARHRLHRRAFHGPVPVTLGVALLLVVVYAIELTSGAPGNAAQLARLGGQVPALVREGQWWRLATASLLHLDPLHLVLNAMGLLTLGFLLERLVGAPRFLWLLVVGAFVSGAASVALGGHVVSVGASGAIFALVGAWLVLNTRHRDDLPAGLCLPGWYIAGIAALEIALEALIPSIDTAAHVGGLVAGMVTALLTLPHRSLERSLARTPRPVRIGAALLAAVFAGCVVLGAWSVSFGGDAYTTRLLVALLDAEREPTPESDVGINELAWMVATSTELPPGGLATSIARMQAVVERNPDEPHFLDTLATLHHRAGDARAAVELERRALPLARVETAYVYAAQLARFHARQLETGDVLGVDAWDGPPPVFRLEPAREDEPGEFVLALDLGAPRAHGTTLEALVWDGETLHALLRVDLAPQPQPVVRIAAPDGTFDRLPDGARIQLALVETSEPTGADGTALEPGGWSWRAHPYVQAVAELP